MKSARFENAEAALPECSTLIDLLTARAGVLPERVAFQFLDDDLGSPAVTYRELDGAARRIASSLQAKFQPGSSAALVFPPGIDFVKAFFGSLYAGLVPIPATYPKPRRRSARLAAIVHDARPAAILTTQRVFETLYESKAADSLEARTWLSIEQLEAGAADAWQSPSITGDDVAFLQYTSGSTKDPRGVEVSHQNITYNLEMIRRGFGLSRADANTPSEVGVSWLPAYHDMGLIGGILESIYVGGTTMLMSPMSFLQRPERWLRAISDHSAVVSGGPNFAYELCLRKIRPKAMKTLDLSSWRVAFSGAEPIRAATLRRFAEVFGACGFSDASFYPCYGLAEATLLVTGGDGPGQVTTCSLNAAELQEQGRAVPSEGDVDPNQQDPSTIELVGCGHPLMDEQVLIVDPETRQPCAENRVGEIWIRGSNVARGYRNHPPETCSTFQERLADSNGVSFLRSGDLGFMRDGTLYVTGRRNELLIIRGRNHYPHDLEGTVQESHAKLIPGGGAAFLVDRGGDQLLILVQEVERGATSAEHETMIAEIRRNVTAEHEVFVHEVILIRPGTLPRTTSGKVRYADVRKEYRDGELSDVARWSFAKGSRSSTRRDAEQVSGAGSELKGLMELPPIDDRQMLAVEIETRLLKWLGHAADVDAAELDPNRPFADYGLDSLAAVELTGQLEDGLGLKLSPTIAWTFPTAATLARHLAEQMLGDDDGDAALEEADDAAEFGDDDFDQLLAQLEQMPEDEVAAMLAAQERPEANQ